MISSSHNEKTFTERLTAVRAQFAAWNIEGLLISSPANRRWLSGFTGSLAYLLITADQALLATDFRYWEQARAEAPVFELVKYSRTQEDLRQFVKSSGVQVIGREADHVTLSEAGKLDLVEGVTWVNLSPTLEDFRAIKNADELAKIRAAAAITDAAMAQVPHIARPGVTEAALAWELEKRMREAGAEAAAFDVIVAGGPNAALPHHHPGQRQLEIGDTLIVDMGAQVEGYKSDMTRSFFVGAEPTEQFWTIYNLVLAAETAVLTHTRPGMNCQEIDAIARTLISDGGHGPHFGHGLGHSLGLDIHERPFFTHLPYGQEYTISPDMTVTIEPGIYIPGWGGVRIEDLVLITESGVEPISQCPKTPVIGGW